jgi:hypothetical protein
MLRREAESAIIDEWMSLPESERLTEQQAAQFALQMKRKYPFDYVGGDIYLEIRRMMMRHQKPDRSLRDLLGPHSGRINGSR